MRAKLDALLSQAITAVINWATRNHRQPSKRTEQTSPSARVSVTKGKWRKAQ